MEFEVHDFFNKDEIIAYLNVGLAARQKVTDSQLAALKVSHQLKNAIFKMAAEHREHGPTLQMLAKVVTALEFEQQGLWNFTPDENYHHFWEVPGCSCPKYDNQERLGSPYKVYNGSCKIHCFRSVK